MRTGSSLMWAGSGSCKSQCVKSEATCEAQAVIAAKGRDVFHGSKGLAVEAMKGNVRLTLILLVDAKKDEGVSQTEPRVFRLQGRLAFPRYLPNPTPINLFLSLTLLLMVRNLPLMVRQHPHNDYYKVILLIEKSASVAQPGRALPW